MFGKLKKTTSVERQKPDIGFGIGAIESLVNSLSDHLTFTRAFDQFSIWQTMERPTHGIVALCKSMNTGGVIEEQKCELIFGHFELSHMQVVVSEWVRLRKLSHSGFSNSGDAIKTTLYATESWHIDFSLHYYQMIDPLPATNMPGTKLIMQVVPA